jgi:ribonuclease J
MAQNLLEILPLGGLGQIGSNMCLFSSPSDNVLIDSGILFPSDDSFNLNYLIPDLDYIPKEKTPSDLIITHGHEDHIGALKHIVTQFPDIKIHAPRFAGELIRSKLKYEKLNLKITVYNEDFIFKFNEFNILPIHVNHSMPDTFGLLFTDNSSNYCCFYASDFKCSSSSIYEKNINLEKLTKISHKYPTRLLMADSTNITSPILKTPCESELLKDFDTIIGSTKSRIFVTTFSSNIYRLKTIITAAKKHNRKIVPYGRSMNTYLEAAANLNLLEFDQSFKDAKAVTSTDENIIVIASGCQGDFKSALRRIVDENDPIFIPRPTDTFIFSSKTIPGNEFQIEYLYNQISKTGAQIITSNDYLVHTSGHPGRDDLKILYDAFKPTHTMPIHGETYFLKKHSEYIKDTTKSKSLFALNYDLIKIRQNGEVSVSKGEDVSPVLIHGNDIPIEKHAIKTRRKMAQSGHILLSIQQKNKKFQFSFHGLPVSFESEAENFENFIKSYLNRNKIKDDDRFINELTISIRQFVNMYLGYKPVTTIHLL